jgi:MoaA/NifB/PqqE/SkfB family radical SAM enzyme
MFASESFCKKVFDAWLEEVTFSFHWHNERLHDYLVDTPWAFKKSLKWLINIKKNYPNIIVNIDTVVNKINVKFLPDIIKFFMKLDIYEFDILQIVPFWRWFQENKNKLFYNIEENINYLKETWKLSKIPWMYMWTNRFPAEAFEWYEDLIQDPRKIKSEVMGEGKDHFEPFILSNWEKKQECYPHACDVCFIKQYCNDFIKNQSKDKLKLDNSYEIIRWEEFPSEVYDKFWKDEKAFILYLNLKIKESKKLINIPKCLWWTWFYETYNDLKVDNSLEDYTYKYINNLYRKKSVKCKICQYNDKCEGIHINFIRSYGFKILQPIE